MQVMGSMRLYAAQGHNIIATLHQPRAAIWAMLDKVGLVAAGQGSAPSPGSCRSSCSS